MNLQRINILNIISIIFIISKSIIIAFTIALYILSPKIFFRILPPSSGYIGIILTINIKRLLSQKILCSPIMMTMVFVVSGVFLIKNLISKAWMAAIAVGACILVFTVLAVGMKLLKMKKTIK